MKKILCRIFSTALAAAIVASSASAQQPIGRTIDRGALSQFSASAQNALPEGLFTVKGVATPDQLNAARATADFKELNSPIASKPSNASKAPKKVQPAAGNMPDIVGCVIYPQNSKKLGLVKVPTAEGQEITNINTSATATHGGFLKDNVYYATQMSSFFGMIFINTRGYNVETGAQLFYYSPSGYENVLICATVDPTTEQVYTVGYQSSGTGYQLCKADYTTTGATFTPIAEFNYNVNSIAIAPDGQMYAIINQVENNVVLGSILCKVDKTDGTWEPVGNTGELCQYGTGAVIDPRTGRMFWTLQLSNQESYLCEVNLTTGEATRLVQFAGNEQIVGLGIIPPAAEDKAPSAPVDLSLDFVDGSLTGNVNFTIPADYYDGTPAEGDVNYSVKVAGVELATGTTTYGSEVSAVCTLDAPGTYEFIVTASNETGESPRARISAFIGNGIPTAPQPTATFVNGEVTLSWSAITTSADGGFIDQADMTYTITDLNSEEVLAQGLTDTTWTGAVEVPEELTMQKYGVTAVCSGISSAQGVVGVALGLITPPYTNDFDTAEDLSFFSVIDANNDGRTWFFQNGTGRCSYHSTNPTDDWLVSPGVKVEAGKAYWVQMDFRGEGYGSTEKVEVCYGDAPTVEGLTKTLLQPIELTTSTLATYGAYLVAETDGVIFIGIHGISKANQYAITVDNFSIAAGIGGLAPFEPSDLVVTPAAYGALFASISFNAPDKSISGDDLSEITHIDICRDGEVVITKYDVTPGAAVKVTDAVDTNGTYTYSVTAYNQFGKGETISAEAYIGVAVPANVQDLTAVVSDDLTKLSISWPAVDVDINGNPIAPDQVTYIITDDEGAPIVEGLTQTSWEYTYTASTQAFVRFGVQACTEGGRSRGILGTKLLAMGPAYVNFDCSFANGDFGGYDFYTVSQGGQWVKCTDDGVNDTAVFNEIKSYDGDNGFIAMQGSYVDNSATLVTGVVSLVDVENPGVTFYTYVLDDGVVADDNTISVLVADPNSSAFQGIKTIVVKNLGQSGWRKVTVPLTRFAGKEVQIAIQATTKTKVYTIIDALKIGSLISYDLAALSIKAPARVPAGDDFSVLVEVANEGSKAVEAYSVELYADGDLVDTKECGKIDPEKTAQIEFVRAFSPLDAESVIYSAKVVYADDANTANNLTDEIVVEPIASRFPAATDLKGEATDAGNALSWKAPDTSDVLPDPYTETFEEADPFTQEYKDWIFVDVDDATIGGFSGISLPDIPTFSGPCSWFVFDCAGEEFNVAFDAYSGTKYLACLYRTDLGQVDDWAISPELLGKAQTISFKARVYHPSYAEAIEIWVSTGSTDPQDFTKLTNKHTLTNQEWNTFIFDVPEGTKRFAIRSCAVNDYMLLVDDISYIPAGATIDVTVVGYDIYRDGVKLNEEVVTTLDYTDTTAEPGKAYTYNVVTIYACGVSLPSDDLTLTTSALDGVTASVTIEAGKGEIIVTGADGLDLQIIAVDGKTLFHGIAEHKTAVAVLPGVYVVKAGQKIVKLIVR